MIKLSDSPKTEEFVEIKVTPGKTIRASIVRVPISKLTLDPENVRFAHLGKSLSDKEMRELISKEEDTENLCKEIEFSEGLRERPIIDWNYVVKEGARRVTCLGLLTKKYENNPVKRKLYETVQCIMLPKDTDPKDIALFLAGVHVSGKKPWDALNKAAHIYALYHDYKMTYDEIRSALSMGKTTVMRFVKSYNYHMEYGKKYGKLDKKNWLKRWSYFDELFKQKELKEWSDSEENVEQFMEWIKDDKIQTGAEVRSLGEIMNNKEAFRIFKSTNGNVKKAIAYLSKVDPTIGSTFYNTIEETIEQIDLMPREEVISTVENKAKFALLKQLQTELGDLISDIEKLKKIKRTGD